MVWCGVVSYCMILYVMALFESKGWFINHKNHIMDRITQVSNFKQK